ncbi:MAG: DASH family cryptochrome [Oligoflexus sp.]|nr:DASH family cryptochrome [Oligoflexus sp.]
MNVLYWLRSDLRLHDNPALLHFASVATHGIILWCPTRSQRRAEAFRRSFIWASVASVAHDLRQLGASVQIEEKEIRSILPELLQIHKIGCIVFSEDSGTEEQSDEAWIRSLGLPCKSFPSGTLLQRNDLPFAIDALPEVFTHFRKKVEDKLVVAKPLAPPHTLPGSLDGKQDPGLDSASIMAHITHSHPKIEAGEKAGLKRLQDYIWNLDRLRVYKATRDGLLEWDDSSKLSPWLSVGSLSPRTIYSEIRRYEDERIKNDSTYWLFFELLWRDYFRWLGLKWGARLFTGMKTSVARDGGADVFESWKDGRTGQGFIDAHMHELARTGWMSNRGRQNVANYLVKTLGVDWRLGARYFEERLIDYDAYSNWGNWAYQAGTGQDPRDRRFNPSHQASMYDSAGRYQQRWNPKGAGS